MVNWCPATSNNDSAILDHFNFNTSVISSRDVISKTLKKKIDLASSIAKREPMVMIMKRIQVESRKRRNDKVTYSIISMNLINQFVTQNMPVSPNTSFRKK